MSIDEQLQSAFWQTLFDPGDYVCVAKYAAGTSVRQLLDESSPRSWAAYVAINALHPASSRSDAAVAKHRSFLVEFDDMAAAEQLDYAASLNLPWSTCVFSGGRSYHFIIALTEPLAAADYQFYAAWLLGTHGRGGAVPGADPTCRNPSRFTRYPGVIRADTGLEQTLVAVRPRVPLSVLRAWLQERAADKEPRSVLPAASARAVAATAVAAAPGIAGEKKRLRNQTLGFLAFGAERHRNAEMFRAACDFAECGYGEEEAGMQLAAVLPVLQALKAEPFTEAEMWRAIRSAFAHVARSKRDAAAVQIGALRPLDAAS